MTSTDHFSTVAHHYAQYRPNYPPELFTWLANHAPGDELAWDCGTGNGQAAVGLLPHFRAIVATDHSAQQVAHATPHRQITYRVALAEQSGLPDQAVDLLTVAQALHWFDLAGFYREAQRVLKPRGLIAAWCYGTLQLDDSNLNALVQHFYQHTLAPYWPPERRLVENGYQDLPFPFTPLPTPPFSLHAQWTLAQLIGYFRSWSACKIMASVTNADPLAPLIPQLQARWGNPNQPVPLRWPLAFRVGFQE